MTYQSEVLADSPTIYLPFTSNSLTNNLGSRGAISVVSSGGQTWGTGIQDAAPVFAGPGSASRVNYNLGTNDFFNDGTWSLEAWIKRGTQSGYQHIIRTADTNNEFTLFQYIADGGANDRKIALDYKTAGAAVKHFFGPQLTDTNWHHVVVTCDGTNIKFYVDNTLYDTQAKGSNGTYVTGTTLRLASWGDAAGNDNFAGSVDEFAIYPAALSATRIGVHYNTALGTNGGYTAQAMTASAAMPDAVGTGNVQTLSITEDANSVGSTASGNATTLDIRSATVGKPFFRLPAPVVPAGNTVTGVVLTLTSTATNSAVTATVAKVNGTWVEGTLTSSSDPGTTDLKTVSLPSAGNGDAVTIDLSDVYSQIDGNGVALYTASGSIYTVATAENAQTAYRPKVTYTLTANTAVGVNADPMTASALMGEGAVMIGDGYAAEPMTATAAMVDPTIQTVRHVEVTASPMTASADMGQNSGWSLSNEFVAGVMTASAESVQPTVTLTQGVIVNAAPFNATATAVKPALVNGNPIGESEATDKYFIRVMASGPKYWARLNDQGTEVIDRMSGQKIGTFVGVQMGQHNGPDNRHSVHFNGDAHFEQGPDDATATVNPVSRVLETTVEFSFRTDKANQFIMAGADAYLGLLAGSTLYAPAREVYLKDGKIGFRSYTFDGTPDFVVREFTGFRNLNDGQWHQVQVRSGVRNTQGTGEIGVEIWIDGTFEVRRFSTGTGAVAGFSGFPDYIGWRPAQWGGLLGIEADLATLPGSQVFEGDMSEVVFYNHINMQSHDIARHFYDFMGWAPIFAEPAEAFAFATNGNAGKGNQRRALYLYWDKEPEAFDLAGGDGTVASTIEFDPIQGFAKKAPVHDYFNYKVFAKGVRFNFETNQGYRDPVTDDLSLINLETDLDLEQYDVIMFKDWPDEGAELDEIEFYFPHQKDRLIEQIKDAVDQGIGLYVTQPRLAADLGVIDRYEFCNTLREGSSGITGNLNIYDYGSAAKFPWNIAENDGIDPPSPFNVGGAGTGQPMTTNVNYLLNKAKYYADTNWNNRFRVRAVIEGLTDIPSWMVTDAVHHWNSGTYAWDGYAYKYLHRDNGLLIGDEYLYFGTNEGSFGYQGNDWEGSRANGAFATPPGHVKAGTVVTTFGAKYWAGTELVDNPYRDYATTIVLQPGDILNGRSIGGKIFVNFTERPSEGLGVPVQVYDADNLPQGYPAETSAQREWEYSWTRTSTTVTGTQGTILVNVTDPVSGQVVSVPVAVPGAGQFSQVRSNQLFTVEGKPRWEMDGRGMAWLAIESEDVDGSVTVRTTPATATAEAPNAAVLAEKDVVIGAQAMSANAQMIRPAEDPDQSAQVMATPMTAYAELTGLSATILATPMTATAELVENFDMVHATGEQIVLTLHGIDATLYIREEV